MSEIEPIIMRVCRLEKLLRAHYHAQGQGLHELLLSCEERLPANLSGKIEQIAKLRNKFLDEDEIDPEEQKLFMSLCHECELGLTPRSGRFIWGLVISLVLLTTLGAIIFYSVYWDEFEHYLAPYFS